MGRMPPAKSPFANLLFYAVTGLVVLCFNFARANDPLQPSIPVLPEKKEDGFPRRLQIALPRSERSTNENIKADGKNDNDKQTEKEEEEKKQAAIAQKKEAEARKKFKPAGVPLSLAECLDIAMRTQPTIKAAQSSLAASTYGYLSLMRLNRVAEVLSPDLPIRRMQAQKGIAVAAAEVQKAQQETTYDVSRMYYTFVYAIQQEQTANSVIEEMEIYYEAAETMLNLGGMPNKKLDQFTLYALQDVIIRIRKMRDKAILGQKQALNAMKEAMGLDPRTELYPRDTELPIMGGDVTENHVVELALGRRCELIQAASAVDVFRLEVCAQARIKHRQSSPTFAQGSDLHSRIYPASIRNGEYKPGVVPPEMPTVVVGKVEDRVARVTELSIRQDAVYEKAVGLVRLEAINAFLGWQTAVSNTKEAKNRYERGKKLVGEARKAATTKQDPELLVRMEAMAGEAQAEYVEAVFKQIEALIHMERVTAGGVIPAFPGR